MARVLPVWVVERCGRNHESKVETNVVLRVAALSSMLRSIELLLAVDERWTSCLLGLSVSEWSLTLSVSEWTAAMTMLSWRTAPYRPVLLLVLDSSALTSPSLVTFTRPFASPHDVITQSFAPRHCVSVSLSLSPPVSLHMRMHRINYYAHPMWL